MRRVERFAEGHDRHEDGSIGARCFEDGIHDGIRAALDCPHAPERAVHDEAVA
jgi:hypothetical protein